MTEEITDQDLEHVHPLVAATILALDERSDGEQLELTAEDVDEIRGGLEAIYGESELRDAVRGFLNLGAHLQETGDREGSSALLDMLAEKPLLDALDALNDERQAEKSEAVAKSSQAFNEFADKAEGKKAPQVGEKKPDGSLSLDQLKFPKRL